MSLHLWHKKSWPKRLPFHLKLNNQTIFSNLYLSVKKYPNTDAIIFYDNKITYSQLYTDIKNVSGYLKQVLNLSSGDRVAIIMQNCPQFIISYYAVLGIGCVIVPINPMLMDDEISFILADSKIKIIFAGLETLISVRNSIKKNNTSSLPVICINYNDYIRKKFNIKLPEEFFIEYKKNIGSHEIEWNEILQSRDFEFFNIKNVDEICIIPYTSGSTGKPKGCIHTNRTVNTVINSYKEWLPIPPKAKVLTTLPLFHVTGMQNSMNVPISNGNTIVLMTRWDIDTAFYFIKKYRIKSWRSITTSIIDLLSQFDPQKHDISSLISIGGGGASMPKKIALKLKKLINLNYVEAYGLTETMAPTHINPPNHTKLGSIGIPIFNVDARIMDLKTNKELGANQVGELIVASPQLFLGYWNRYDSNKCFINLDNKKFFRTGDLAYFDDSGYFYIVDRIKRMINQSGFKIWPAEIEKILHNFDGIKEVCVIGTPDYRTGQKVKAVIVPEKSFSEKQFYRLIKWCEKRMAKYKIPKIFELRENLPKNKMGKILWRDLS